MLRGYRGLGFAALVALVFVSFGLGVLTISLGNPEQQKRYQSYPSGNENKVGALATIPNLASSGMQHTPCKKPQSEAERDLCEQWRAANAAEKSAQWAVFGVIASIVGISLLMWQIMLTREAVKDTGDATKAMREANEIAQLAQRAWIVVEARPTKVSHGNGRFLFNIDITFKNVGQSQATTLAYNCIMIDRQSDYLGYEWLYNIGGDFTGNHQGASLSPTESFFTSKQFVIENEGEKPLLSTRALLFVGASYETPAIKGRLYILRVFSISKRGSSSLYFQEADAPLHEQEIVATPFGEGYTT